MTELTCRNLPKCLNERCRGLLNGANDMRCLIAILGITGNHRFHGRKQLLNARPRVLDLAGMGKIQQTLP